MASICTKPSKAACSDISVSLLFWSYILALMIGPIGASPGMSAETFGSRSGFLKRGSGDSASNTDADSHAHSLATNTTSASPRQLRSQQLPTKRFPSDVMTCIAGKPVLRTQSMDPTKYDAVGASVTKLYHRLPKHCNSTSCPQADWAGCVLRMSGHDFMDFDPVRSLGGSDGCIDFDDADNKGLDKCLYMGEFHTSLHEAYQEHCLDVSLADFFVVSAEAIMNVMRPANTPPIDFKNHFRFGRVTSPSCTTLPALPDAEKGCGAVEQTFLKQMGLTWRDAAALMGVHTLGRAQKHNSGYNGWWSSAENSRIFNNNYYASMIAKGWRPGRAYSDSDWRRYNHLFPDTSPDKVQWVRFDVHTPQESQRHEMMLNTDMCLLYANHHGQPVLASRDTCCAWVSVNGATRNAPIFYSNEAKKSIGANSDGSYCGKPLWKWQSVFEREQHRECCGNIGFPFAKNCGRNNPNQVRLQRELDGPAEPYIFEFAASESAWLSAFLPAWKKATENGQEESLRPLVGMTTTTTTTIAEPASMILGDINDEEALLQCFWARRRHALLEKGGLINCATFIVVGELIKSIYFPDQCLDFFASDQRFGLWACSGSSNQQFRKNGSKWCTGDHCVLEAPISMTITTTTTTTAAPASMILRDASGEKGLPQCFEWVWSNRLLEKGGLSNCARFTIVGQLIKSLDIRGQCLDWFSRERGFGLWRCSGSSNQQFRKNGLKWCTGDHCVLEALTTTTTTITTSSTTMTTATTTPFATPAPTPSPSNPLPRCVSLQSSHGKYVYADFDGEVRAVSDNIGEWEKLSVVQLGAAIALRSIHGKYLYTDSWGGVYAKSDAIQEWERYVVTDNFDGTISLRSFHGKYVYADTEGYVRAGADQVGEWERFRVTSCEVKLPSCIYLKSFHNKYMMADPSGKVLAMSFAKDDWERFEVISGDGRTVSFKSSHGKYLYADLSGGVYAKGEAINDWENFQMTSNADGSVSFMSRHGKYMYADSLGQVKALADKIGAWERFSVEDCLVV